VWEPRNRRRRRIREAAGAKRLPSLHCGTDGLAAPSPPTGRRFRAGWPDSRNSDRMETEGYLERLPKKEASSAERSETSPAIGGN